jgi:hypothetical protein
MENILQRIEQIAYNEKIKITALEREIGASKGVLSRAISNGTDIQSKWIQLIVENYPRYSPEWLLTGQGEMLKKQENNAPNQSIIGDNNVQAGNNSKVDARHYSDSPDVLRFQIDEKDRLLAEKETRIKEKDAQIKEKDAQINKLLFILSNKQQME